MKKLKKLVVFALILALVLPSAVIAAPQDDLEAHRVEFVDRTEENLKRLKENPDLHSRFNTKADLPDLNFNELMEKKEKVRVIVEVDAMPAARGNAGAFKQISPQAIANVETINTKVMSSIKAKGVELDNKNSFTNLFAGFSAVVESKDLDVIKKVPGVKAVYEAQEYHLDPIEPDMTFSHTPIYNRILWDLGIRGEGTVVAILDTGIDETHKDFVLTDEGTAKLSKADVDKIVASEGLPGKYLTAKVPYAYNYFDNSIQNADLGPGASMHGMHVAGTVGANGAVEGLADGTSIKGVAPETQLLNMKVFGNDPIYTTTYSDIYMAAIDDAIALGADVINMSLGSDAATNRPDDPMNKVITNAVEHGVDVAISAGNASHTFYGWADRPMGLPFFEDQDFGVVGSPGVATDSLAVASYENLASMKPSLKFTSEGEVVKTPYAWNDRVPHPSNMNGKELYDLGMGTDDEFAAVTEEDLAGKIVVIRRGEQNFVVMAEESEKRGAAGLIVYNKPGDNSLVNMMEPENTALPSAFIGHDAGLKLLKSDAGTVEFTEDLVETANPNYGLMSEFSSRGTTPALEIKPEISTPGGSIYSTANDNKYQVMSGTSMAAPHAAGGLALIKQSLKDQGLSPEEEARLAKAILMNTADLLGEDEAVFEDGAPFSVRLQGAGGMNLARAESTPFYAVESQSKEAKIELGILDSTTFTVSLDVTNRSEAPLTVSPENIDVIAITDVALPGSLIDPSDENLYNFMQTAKLDASVTADGFTLAPGETKTVSLTVESEDVEEQFLEGWIILKTDYEDQIQVPFLGFKGDWYGMRILDGFEFMNLDTFVEGDQDSISYYNWANLYALDFLGKLNLYSEKYYALSHDEYSWLWGTNALLPVVSLLRNTEILNTSLLDADGNLVAMINKEVGLRKSYFDRGNGNPFSFEPDRYWEGDARGEAVPDGKYYMQFETRLQNAPESQFYKVPVHVDSVAPVVTDVYRVENKLYVRATDDFTGVNQISAELVNKNDTWDYHSVEGTTRADDLRTTYDKDLYVIELGDIFSKVEAEELENFELSVNVYDHAMNSFTAGISSTDDDTMPFIYVEKPELLQMFDTNEIPLEGYIIKDEEMNAYYQIDTEDEEGELVEIPLEAAEALKHGKEELPGYTFKLETIELHEGYNLLKVHAKAKRKESVQSTVSRELWVDTIDPVVELVSVETTGKNEITVSLKVDEQLPYFEVWANTEKVHIFDEYSTLRGKPSVSETVTFTIPKYDAGEYPVSLEVVDAVGNKTSLDLVAGEYVEQADRFTAVAKDLEVEQLSEVHPADAIANKEDLPEGTSYEFKDGFDTSEAGEFTVAILVNFPDGSSQEVEAKITVVEAEPVVPVEPEEEAVSGYLKAKIFIRPEIGSKKSLGVTSINQFVEGTTSKDSAWVKFEYQGKEAYIAKSFLVDEPVQDQGYLSATIVIRKTSQGTGVLGQEVKGRFVKGVISAENNEYIEYEYKGQKGYLHRHFIKDEPIVQKVRFTSDVYVRSGKSSSSEKLGIVKAGTEVTARFHPYWVEFEFKGQKGFAAAKFVKKVK